VASPKHQACAHCPVRREDEDVTRGPDEKDEPQIKGGKAAERLRQFLAERYGDDAPPIPPDEDEEKSERDKQSDSSGDGSEQRD
jgi:hypothetical protein